MPGRVVDVVKKTGRTLLREDHVDSSSTEMVEHGKEDHPKGKELTGDQEALCMETGHDGLSEDEAMERLKTWGRNQLPDLRVPKWKLFLSHFTGIMPGMIIVAVLVEGFLQEWPDFGTLLTLLFLNGAVGFWEDLRAGDAVAALKASLKPIATVKREGVWRKIDAALLVPGDRVSLAAGCNVPADCRVDAGMEIQVDQAAMTGESLPVQMGEGDVCKMGSTIVAGETDGTVATTGINTFFGKTAALISSTHDVGNFQRVIIKITKILLYMSSLLVGIAGAYLMFKDGFSLKTFWPAVSFCVVLLVASIPIAMQVVCTATMALGSRLLAAQKAIVARLSSIEQLAGMTVLCSDKTGICCSSECPAPAILIRLSARPLARRHPHPQQDGLARGRGLRTGRPAARAGRPGNQVEGTRQGCTRHTRPQRGGAPEGHSSDSHSHPKATD